jgi:hypothetical protein
MRVPVVDCDVSLAKPFTFCVEDEKSTRWPYLIQVAFCASDRPRFSDAAFPTKSRKETTRSKAKISRVMSARPMHPPLITRIAFSKRVFAIRSCDFRCSFQSQK